MVVLSNYPDSTRLFGQALGLSAFTVPLRPKPLVRFRTVRCRDELHQTRGFPAVILHLDNITERSAFAHDQFLYNPNVAIEQLDRNGNPLDFAFLKVELLSVSCAILVSDFQLNSSTVNQDCRLGRNYQLQIFIFFSYVTHWRFSLNPVFNAQTRHAVKLT